MEYNRENRYLMFSYVFFHPDHVIPVIELIAAGMELTDFGESHMRMEGGTVVGEIGIFFRGIADAGIQIQYAHPLKSLFKGFIKHSAQALFFSIVIKIDAQF